MKWEALDKDTQKCHLAAKDGGHAENCLEQFLPWLLGCRILAADGLYLKLPISYPFIP
ncbi:MAG: hypothetical protein BMS9Abin31_0018 [Gammaproteobacteria bacterium]|nr:MAG: hypothetical protein BMS9Abin31_0018 [Gammaproteobacteria bacterium]